jgi:hypothetical protein
MADVERVLGERSLWIRRLFALPANAAGSLVVLRRPFTFTAAILFALVASFISLFFTILHLPVPECILCRINDDTPRTRPRPPPRTNPKSTSRTTIASFSSSIATSSRSLLSFARPRRVVTPVGGNRGDFPRHELDDVVESEEEYEGIYEREEEDDPGCLTPDQESESDPSEVDAVAGAVDVLRGDGKGKEMVKKVFWRKTKRDMSANSLEDDDWSTKNSASSSSGDAKGSTSSSKKSSKSFPYPSRSLRRSKSATRTPSPGRPLLISAFSDPHPHPVAEPESYTDRPPLTRSSTDFTVIRDSPSSSSSSSSAPSSPKRNTASFFKRPFRSRSPLSRPPLASPHHSPPASPLLPPTIVFTPTSAGRQMSLDSDTASLDGKVAALMDPKVLDASGKSGLALSDILP